MRILKKIVFIKADGTIQLLDQDGRVYRYRQDDKIICDLKTLNTVCQVLEALSIKMAASTNVDEPEPCWVLERDMTTKCDGCGNALRSVVVTLNENEGMDGAGHFFLTDHPAYSTQKCFCSDECLVRFLQEHPEEAISCVPSVEEIHGFRCDRTCYTCEKTEGPFISVKGEYESVLDDINYPHYFCSVQCIIDAVHRNRQWSSEA